MHSAIYRGSLRHRRFAPRPHAFRYSLFMVYLDLAELDTVFKGRWLWSAHRPAIARFDRADHFGDPNVPLERCVRDLVERETGARPAGPVRLLTHLRYFGHCINPVSYYYCFDASGEKVETLVAEVTNTPWGERHCYVLSETRHPRTERYLRYETAKRMHVSPFMPMDVGYTWGFSPPDETLNVHMGLHAREKVFDATLTLTRKPITGVQLARALIEFPLMTLKVAGAIHWEALKLWLKGVPVHTHPAKIGRVDKSASAAEET
jgi:DUF1365 family protein